MLTIRKHPLSLRATLLGTVAFLIGLGGAGAYVDRMRQHENLVFGLEETVLGASDIRSAEQGSSSDEAQDTASSQQTASPEVMSGEAVEVVPMGSVASNGSVASSPAPASTSQSATLEPGRGAGPVAEEPEAPSIIETIQGSCLIQNCVITTVEETAGNLLGQ